jgi:hypothetical protein
MARSSDNPDRNFSADGDPAEDFEGLRRALKHDEPAQPYNEAAKLRIGKLIAQAFARWR